MKKRMLSLLLTLCMVLSMTVTVSFAVEDSETVTYPEQYCDGTHEEGVWLPLYATMVALKEERAAADSANGARYILPEGNYYLEKDITLSSTIYIMGNVNICLNGKVYTSSLTGANAALLTYSGALDGVPAVTGSMDITICDCSAEKTGGITSTATSGSANAIKVNAGPSAVTIQGGTYSNFMGSGIEIASTAAGTSLTIEGGTITGNGRGLTDNGGGVYTKMPFTMTGGTISYNKAKAQGGGVYIGGKTATISGGKIEYNEAKNSTASGDGGGGVYVINKGAVLNMTGGEISNNTANRGGGVYAYYMGIFNMSGGIISENTVTSTTHPSAVYLSGTRDLCTLSGGSIVNNNSSGVYVVGKASASFEGVTVTDNTKTQVVVQKLTSNTATETPASMKHYISVSDGTLGAVSVSSDASSYVTLNVTGGNIGSITVSENGTESVTISGGRFAKKPPAAHVVSGKVAGKDNADPDFPWTIGDPYTATVASGIENGTVTLSPETSIEGATVTVTAEPAEGYKLESLTVDGVDIMDTKSFVLVADAAKNVVNAAFVFDAGAMTAEALLATAVDGIVTLTKDVTLQDTLNVTDALVLDLNGYTLDGKVYPYINVPDGGELTIQDSGENGAISGVEDVSNENALIHVAGKVTLDDGKIINHTLNKNGMRGIAVRLKRVTGQTTAPEFIMNGGEISGHSAGTSTARGTIGLYAGAKFTLNDGKISDNTAQYGAAFAGSTSTDNMAIEINGGVITGNNATLGGSVMFIDRTDVVVNGGSIYGNTTGATQASYKTALFINCPLDDEGVRHGSFTMTGGTIGADAEGSTATQAVTVQREGCDISGTAVIGGKGLYMNTAGEEIEIVANIHNLEEGAYILVRKGDSDTSVEADDSVNVIEVPQKYALYASPVAECDHAQLFHVPAADASCTKAGNIEYWVCACGSYFKDAEAETETDLAEIIIPAAHTFGELVPAQEEVHKPDELKAAVAAYYFCSACEKYFTESMEATTLEALTSAAPVHDYTNVNGYKSEAGHADTCACGAMTEVAAHTPNVDAATEETAKYCTVCDFVIEEQLTPASYFVFVNSGKAQMPDVGEITSAAVGSTVTLVAAPYGTFDHWTVDEGTVELADPNAEITTFTMPAEDVVFTAHFKAAHTCSVAYKAPVAATCFDKGSKEYWECTDATCGKIYADADAQTEITDASLLEIPAAHNYGELVPAQPEVHTADVLKPSVAAHYFCAACETYFNEGFGAVGYDVLTGPTPTHTFDPAAYGYYVTENSHAPKCSCGAYGIVDSHNPNADFATEESAKFCTVCEYIMEAQLPHNCANHLDKTEAEPESCTEAGNIEYWTCSCGKVYADENAKSEITLADTVIPAKHLTVAHDGKPAAPGIAGYEAYETCSRCDYSTYTEIPALEIAADQQVSVDSFKEAGKAPVSQSGFFGGYYADADKTEVFEGISGSAYVKFVSKNVLSVKYQFTAGTTAASESTDLRLVTTVDDLNYREIGFTIFFGDRQAKVSTRTVFSSIVANDGGVAFTETPKLFDAQSNYFMTYTITGVPASEFGTDVKVVPYWITLDGTVQEGLELNFRISDKI